jgi:hypothetical protein
LVRLLAGRDPSLAQDLGAGLGFQWQAPDPGPGIDGRDGPMGSGQGRLKTPGTDSRTRTVPVIESRPPVPPRFWRLTRCETSDDAAQAGRTTTADPIPVYQGWRGRPTDPPDEPPLAPWRELRSRLGSLLHSLGHGRGIDLDRVVRRISRGELLRRLPREQRRRWGRVLLIEDHSRRLTPFWGDQRRLRRALIELLPPHALTRAVYRDGMDAPRRVGDAGAADKVQLRPPEPGTVVLVLGDLGCLAHRPGAERRIWGDLGRELRAAGCHPAALIPAPASRWDPGLRSDWRMMSWQRPATGPVDVDRERRLSRLLHLVSPAARLEPGLLRALRRLLPDEQADAATEADLWQHPWLLGNSSAGVSLQRDQVRGLRDAFAHDRDTRLKARALATIRAWHGYLPEELWFEELFNLSGGETGLQALSAELSLDLAAELDRDLADARGYFQAFCGDNTGGGVQVGAADAAWFTRVEERAGSRFWLDERVGKALWLQA